MLISVIILHANKADYSRACLESLARVSHPEIEVINVNNGSTDDTASLLESWRPDGIETRTLSFDSNIGAVRGRNEALQIARGEAIAFLDNDVILGQPNVFEILENALFSRPECGIVVPKLVFPFAPFLVECLGAGVSRSGKIEYLERGKPRETAFSPREVQCAISAAWLCKREVFEKIGALDEAFSPVQFEDLDFCYRAKSAGFSVWTAPDAEIFHFEHTTTAGSADINFRYVTTKNFVEFKKRWRTVFENENGPTDEAATWRDLPKKSIEDLDWRALLPLAEA